MKCEQILQATADITGISIEELAGKRKFPKYAKARRLFIYTAYQQGFKGREISELINKYYSGVRQLTSIIRRQLRTKPKLRANFYETKKLILERIGVTELIEGKV